jgi:hypothetical protein
LPQGEPHSGLVEGVRRGGVSLPARSEEVAGRHEGTDGPGIPGCFLAGELPDTSSLIQVGRGLIMDSLNILFRHTCLLQFD